MQEACAQWVAELFALTGRDPATASVAVVGSSSATFLHEAMPARVRALLAPWRRHLA